MEIAMEEKGVKAYRCVGCETIKKRPTTAENGRLCGSCGYTETTEIKISREKYCKLFGHHWTKKVSGARWEEAVELELRMKGRSVLYNIEYKCSFCEETNVDEIYHIPLDAINYADWENWYKYN